MIESSMENPTIYIIEDDAPLRQSVESLVSSKGYRCESFDSVEAFLSKKTSIQQPGCILLDFHLSGCDGLSFLKHHSEQANATPVVVLTAHADVPLAVQFMKAGALMLLRKPYEPKELLESMDAALEWDRRLIVLRKQSDRIRECFQQISNRQEVVLQCILDGAPNKTIAARLDVSDRTIEMERAEILRIFQVKNAVELAVVITESRVKPSTKSNETSKSESSSALSKVAEPHLLSKATQIKQSTTEDLC